MKIIFAKALDGYRSAIVFDTGNGKIIGGVGYIARASNDYKLGGSLLAAARYEGIDKTHLDIKWEWCKSVNAEEFERERLWENPPQLTKDRS